MNNSDKALILTTTLMITFVVIVLTFVWFEKSVPDSLIYCTLGSGTAEFGICGWIYSVKKAQRKKPVKKVKDAETDAKSVG